MLTDAPHPVGGITATSGGPTIATIVVGIVAIASALSSASQPKATDLETHAHRAVRHWQQGDIAGARHEFGAVLRLKRRQADVLVEEI